MSSTPSPANAPELDPVLAAAERAPVGGPESAEERASVLAAMVEAQAGAEAVPHDVVVGKLATRR